MATAETPNQDIIETLDSIFGGIPYNDISVDTEESYNASADKNGFFWLGNRQRELEARDPETGVEWCVCEVKTYYTNGESMYMGWFIYLGEVDVMNSDEQDDYPMKIDMLTGKLTIGDAPAEAVMIGDPREEAMARLRIVQNYG